MRIYTVQAYRKRGKFCSEARSILGARLCWGMHSAYNWVFLAFLFQKKFFERGSLISNNGTRTFFTASNRGFLPKNFLKKLLKVQINFVLSLKTSNSHGDGLENPETPSRILPSGMRHQGCQNPRYVKVQTICIIWDTCLFRWPWC